MQLQNHKSCTLSIITVNMCL